MRLYDDGNVRNKGVSPFSYLFDKLYRLDEIERVKMADLEKVSVATIDREIKKIAEKIKKVI